MGGTTTDCAVVSAGRPAINAEGALIGGWRTMVEAVDVRTVGLGGDSQVSMDRDGRMTVGPRKADALVPAGARRRPPALLGAAQSWSTLQHLPDHATQFALRNPGREAPLSSSAIERRVWNELSTRAPARVAASCNNAPGLARTASPGRCRAGHHRRHSRPATPCTCSEGNRTGTRRRRNLGARLLAIEERNMLGASEPAAAQVFCERTVEHVIRESARMVLATALAHDPGVESQAGSWGHVGRPAHRRGRGRPAILPSWCRREFRSPHPWWRSVRR